MQSQKKMLTELEEIILSILSVKSRYGFEITGLVKSASNGGFDLSAGTLYPILRRLEKAGLLTSAWGESGGAARRRYYQATDLGKAELERKVSFREKVRTYEIFV